MPYLLDVKSSSIAAVTTLSFGKRFRSAVRPFREATRFTNMTFSSETPLCFKTSIALEAEPPVANIGSRIKTAAVVRQLSKFDEGATHFVTQCLGGA